MTTSPPKPRTTSRITSSSVAITTRSKPLTMSKRRRTHSMIGSPPRSHRGFPGSRVELIRAGTTATAVTDGEATTCGRLSWRFNSRHPPKTKEPSTKSGGLFTGVLPVSRNESGRQTHTECLTLRELEASTSTTLPVLLTFNDARITSQEAERLERCSVLWVELE